MTLSLFARAARIEKMEIKFISGRRYVLEGKSRSQKSWKNVRSSPGLTQDSFISSAHRLARKNHCWRNEMKTRSISRTKNTSYRDTTMKRGQNLLALARSPADNDPLVLSAPRVISFRFPVARAIGSPLSYVLIPVIFPAIDDRWFSVPFSRVNWFSLRFSHHLMRILAV